MPFLLVDIDGCEIARDRERIVVHLGSVCLGEYIPMDLDAVVAWGRVEITRPAIDMLLSRKVAIHLITSNGRYRGSILPAERYAAKTRRAQYRALEDSGMALGLARLATKTELRNLRTVVRRWRTHRDAPVLGQAASEIAEVIDTVDDATTPAELRGAEGYAWRLSYEALAAILPDEVGFMDRERRPPPDPANALLGLFGVLTVNMAAAALLAVGLDPGFGYLHSSKRGGPALAMDLADIYRPMLCLAPVATLFTKRMLDADNFEGLGYSARLKRSGRRAAFRAYSKACRRAVTRRDVATDKDYLEQMNEDARALASSLRDGDIDWRPLAIR